MPLVKGTSSVADCRALSKALKQTKFPKHFSSKVQDWSKIQRTVITNWIEKQITASLGFEDEIVSNTAVNLFLPPEDNSNTQTTTDINPRTAQIDLAGFLGDEDAAKFASELWELLLDASQQPTGIPRKILDAKMKEYTIQQEQQKLLALEKEKKRPSHRTDGNHADNEGTVGKRSRWGDKTRYDSTKPQTDNQRNANINYPHAMYSENRSNSNFARAGEVRTYNNNSDHRRPDRIIDNKYNHQWSDRNAALNAEPRREDRNRDHMPQSRWVDYDAESGAKNQTGDQNKTIKSANDTSYSTKYTSSSNDHRTENNGEKRRGISSGVLSTIPRTEEYEYDTFGRRVRSPQGVSVAENTFSHHRHRKGKVDELPRHGTSSNRSDRFDNNYHNFNSRDRYHPTNQQQPRSQHQYDDRGQEWRRHRPPSPRRDNIVNRRGDNTSPSLTTNREVPLKREVRRSRSRSRSRSPSYSSHSRSASNSYSSTSSRGSPRRQDRRNRSRSSSSSVSSRTSASSSSSFSTRGSNDK